MRNIGKRRNRTALLAALACVAMASIGAGSASAAATLQVTTDNNQAGSLTTAKFTTQLSGYLNAKRQYGAKIVVPASLNLSYYHFGNTSQWCDAGSFSVVSTPLGNVSAFDNSSCPDTARIGTATLGSLSGSIYAVNASPLPAIAVYFDQGTSTPFGRRINTSWDENSRMTMVIGGLPNISTDGLTLNFDNPGRAGGLSSKVFKWEQPSATCGDDNQVTGLVYTWPLIVIPGYSTYGTTTATPATLTMQGCDYSFRTYANTTTPGAQLNLRLNSTIYDTNATQYGQKYDLPLSVWVNFPGWSGPSCSPASIGSISTGLYPGAMSFDNASCPAGSIIGSATLGSQTGKIYLVNKSPMPQFGVWFDGGTAQPYGRMLSIDWGAEGDLGPQLRIFGLQGAPGAGLQLNFTPPVEGQSSTWILAPASSEDCGTANAKSTIYTYPASGTSATVAATLQSTIGEYPCS